MQWHIAPNRKSRIVLHSPPTVSLRSDPPPLPVSARTHLEKTVHGHRLKPPHISVVPFDGRMLIVLRAHPISAAGEHRPEPPDLASTIVVALNNIPLEYPFPKDSVELMPCRRGNRQTHSHMRSPSVEGPPDCDALPFYCITLSTGVHANPDDGNESTSTTSAAPSSAPAESTSPDPLSADFRLNSRRSNVPLVSSTE
jgi:hypothetical protein